MTGYLLQLNVLNLPVICHGATLYVRTHYILVQCYCYDYESEEG